MPTWERGSRKDGRVISMSTIDISLPESLKTFVDEQVRSRGYGTSSGFVRALLVEGAALPHGRVADGAYCEGLRARVRRPAMR